MLQRYLICDLLSVLNLTKDSASTFATGDRSVVELLGRSCICKSVNVVVCTANVSRSEECLGWNFQNVVLYSHVSCNWGPYRAKVVSNSDNIVTMPPQRRCIR